VAHEQKSDVPPGTTPPGRGVAGLAAVALGWRGLVVEGVSLFGERVTIVAGVNQGAHEQRVTSGWGPVVDRMSVAMLWEWPEYRAVVSPVTVEGVLARGRRWQRALAKAGGFVGFCSTAILLDQEYEPNQHCLVTAHWYGVSVLRLAQGVPVLVQPGRDGPVETARPSALSRWVEELVYARLLQDSRITLSEAG